MYTLENCEALWDQAGQFGTPEERMAQSRRWFPYYSFMANLAANAPYHLPETPSPFVAFLLREGLLEGNDSVLDIGAGMGGCALEFAGHCRSVTALEPNKDCLDVLMARAKKCGLGNLNPVHAMWEEFSPEEPFDLTFSAMCPAICNVEELRRMESMTKKTCCLIAVQRGSYEKHRRAMMQALCIRPKGGMTTEAIHYLNALYLMGRQVNVKTLSFRQTYHVPAERVLEQYPIYFEIFGVSQQASTAFLEDYLQQHAPDGMLEDEALLHQMLIYWEAPQA